MTQKALIRDHRSNELIIKKENKQMNNNHMNEQIKIIITFSILRNGYLA